MHLLVRDSRSLDQDEVPVDLGQSPADLVFLSYSDSDLGAAAAAWQADAGLPGLRLANLAQLRHPMSVDLYVEQVIEHAQCVVVRLLGGLDYWRYGAEEVAATCRRMGTPLALLPGDGNDDFRLAELSTVAPGMRTRLAGYLSQGGPANTAHALELAAHLAGLGEDAHAVPEPMPIFGVHDVGIPDRPGGLMAAIVFYRSYLLAGDAAPIEALAAELLQHDLNVRALFVSSLKDTDAGAFVRAALLDWSPAVVLNATGFSARLDGHASPLDAAGVPVLQLVLSGSEREAWKESARGLSQADLAMQVVLPELDGRLAAGAVSFKTQTGEVAGLEYSRTVHRPDADGISHAAGRAAAWARLGATPRSERKIALILSDYPGAGGQAAHAVGLDALESAAAILAHLSSEGFGTGDELPDAAQLAARVCEGKSEPFLALEDYTRLFDALPQAARGQVTAAWGPPEDETDLAGGQFVLRYQRLGNFLVALQPGRGRARDRKASYHDPDLPPRHAYVAFYLWLREVEQIDALIHLGTHGTLEWLPGKAVALSGSCFPPLLTGPVPVVYPFIVNNPGEAAAAKRRLGAVTVGHLTPPLMTAGTHGAAAEIEKLIDEFAAADGLDRRRTGLLRREILERAGAAGLLEESGVTEAMSENDALARLDARLCDVKDLQIRDGLHVFGEPPAPPQRKSLLAALAKSCSGTDAGVLASRLDTSAAAERAGLVAALDARFVEPGPAGAPTRGRADVLPTGRNLYAVDPRAIPTRSAMALAEKAADELLRRHLQDHGDWPRSMVVDLWGSATMRTGGEDLGVALLLMGARPVWDHGSARVTGIEVLTLADLDRPRIDVTVRISGLFRDAFETQIALFDSAVNALAARGEPAQFNPLAAAARGLEGEALRRATTRIYGAAPQSYGAGVAERLTGGAWTGASGLGSDYLDASGFAYGHGRNGEADRAGFADRVRDATAFVHTQDHAETDLLDSLDYAAHEGGFAAAADLLGAAPALYHSDTSVPESPKTQTLAEEVRRIVRGRAANPKWIRGMTRHGYRGAAEITRCLDPLVGFAVTVPERFDRQFDLLFDATLGDADIDRFLCEANPAAREAMAAGFAGAIERGLWQPRRNTVTVTLAEARP
ncbi:MAG TPA: cobaltochelatase subunit CobN [Alphaproteobacteria bacterium]|nr:cobaltochelatase subunit CobN [Alphaproteobacteria bacterium]